MSKLKFLFTRGRIILGIILIAVGLNLVIPGISPYIYLSVAQQTPKSVAKKSTEPKKTIRVDGKTLEIQGSISIPKIKTTANIFEGVENTKLKYGVGHYPNSSWPDKKGNIALTGHHNFGHDYGQGPLFSLLHLLKKNDKVFLNYGKKRYTYKVLSRHIVEPNEIEAFRKAKDDRLTLITCYPPLSTAKRIVIVAK